MAPCLLGYAAVAAMLRDHADTTKEGNPYWPWIENYNAEDYMEAVRLGSGKTAVVPLSVTSIRRLTLLITLCFQKELIEKQIVLQSPSRIEELVKIFIHATNVSPTCFVFLPVSSVIDARCRWKSGSGRCFHTDDGK
jgi:hydroxymethylpyrimidine/phosphomethylpyrimidine kinase